MENNIIIYSGAIILDLQVVITKNILIGGNFWFIESIPSFFSLCATLN
jgi:hypothetical protein